MVPLDNGLSIEDMEELVKPFTTVEVEKAVFGMKHNKAPGPDGLPIEFYQKFWKLISKDVMDLFSDFYKGSLDISRFNYGIVTLLPKLLMLAVSSSIGLFVC